MQSTENKGVIEKLVERYPQLSLEPAEGLSQTPEYQSIVKRGNVPESLVHHFKTSEFDTISKVTTPAGCVEVVYLYLREDFERAVQLLAYRGEKRSLPLSMGAIAINGIVNWNRIHAHQAEYLAAGNTDWRLEFRRFTATPENYRDFLILLSEGPYSGVPCTATSWEEQEWLKKSKIIRMYHELAHFVSQRRFPDHKNALRDEVIADSIGIYEATGNYDARLAKTFLGLECETYRSGARLENYIKEAADLNKACSIATQLIMEIDGIQKSFSGSSFEFLEQLEEHVMLLPSDEL